MAIRDRVKELRRVKASELRANPENWRVHPTEQQNALRGIMEEVGFAGALLARELEDGTLILIDGHLRADTAEDEEVPVLVLDVNENEAKKLLLTFDPISAMANANTEKLDALLASVPIEDSFLNAMLQDVARIYDCEWGRAYTEEGDIDRAAEWTGMPDCDSEDQVWASIRVNFFSQEDVASFAALVNQEITDKTKSINYPYKERDSVAGQAYEA